MERRMGGRTLAWGAALVLPTLLVLLFETRKWDRTLMDRWVSGVMAPLEQQLGRFWGQISWCSAAELLTALLLAGCVLWLIWTVAGLLRRRDGRAFGRRLLALAAVLLWLWCGFCWMWNAAYYASSFQEKSGLRVQPYPVETLIQVTALFAQRAAEFSTQVERDENGRFAVSRDEILARGPEVYENVAREYPFLALEGQTAAKLHFFLPAAKQAGLYRGVFPLHRGGQCKCGRPRLPPSGHSGPRDGPPADGGLGAGGQLCGDPGGGDQRGPGVPVLRLSDGADPAVQRPGPGGPGGVAGHRAAVFYPGAGGRLERQQRLLGGPGLSMEDAAEQVYDSF